MERKISFLKDRNSYEEEPEKIEIRETHMSFVFLTQNHVYKLKKPIKIDFLDFRTLESRRYNCEEEMRLNKRLAKGVYLDLIPLNINNRGELQLGGEGKTVDWLVKMKRLKDEEMLDYALREGTVEMSQVRQAARMLAEFYKNSPPVIMDTQQYLERLEERISANSRELQDPEFHLSETLLQKITTGQIRFLRSHSTLLKKRIQEGRIIESHGDLKPEHICIGPSPVIIDCLEFNRDLRIMDAAEELAFLAVECELLGSEEVGAVFFEEYERVTKDHIPILLKNFYKSKQAVLRSRFAIWHVKEARYRENPKWTRRAADFLKLAEKYTALLVS